MGKEEPGRYPNLPSDWGSRWPQPRARAPICNLLSETVVSFLQSRQVSAEQVSLIPQCAECLEVWLPGDAESWRAYLDTEDELAVCSDSELF